MLLRMNELGNLQSEPLEADAPAKEKKLPPEPPPEPPPDLLFLLLNLPQFRFLVLWALAGGMRCKARQVKAQTKKKWKKGKEWNPRSCAT